MKFSKVIKAIVFVLIFLVGFSAVQTIFEVGDERSSQRIKGFFEERENSLDAVFLGSSASYAFWSAPIAFAEHGITVYPLATSSQPTFAAKFLIEDARKTQPDAVYIINISNIQEKDDKHLQKLLVDYPLTFNKLLMTDYLCDFFELGFSERMEFYLPIIRFHGRWTELKESDFYLEKDEYKCGNFYDTFLNLSGDIMDFEYDFETENGLAQKVIDGLNDLMDYCEKENVKVLFFVSPQAITEKRMGRQNVMIEMLEERGFDVLDLRKCVNEIGLDFETDYYNNNHTNIHGSIKTTDYISRYLIEKYGLEDKRGLQEYSDWAEASTKYYEAVSEYLWPGDYEYLNSLKQ